MPRRRPAPPAPLATLALSLSLAAATLVAAPLATAPLAAQTAVRELPRPPLPAEADPNDWEAYFDRGVAIVRDRPELAEQAYYWSSRLNPERAEPLAARWVAFHLRDFKRWRRYLDDHAATLARPDVIAMDSVRALAMQRNPFVHRGLEIVLWDVMPGRWGRDAFSQGWIAYSAPDFPAAVRLLGRAIDRDPKRFLWVRSMRAQAFVAMQRYDSALAELTVLRDELTRLETVQTLEAYQSKEILHYALALLHLARREPGAAREALGAALADNLGFHPARIMLGDLLAAERDFAGALAEYDAALDVTPFDPVVHLRRARALQPLNRSAEAAAALERAIAAEPYWAAPWLELGRARERTGDVRGAIAAYDGYLERAPRDAARERAQARERRELLRGMEPPAGTPAAGGRR